MDEPTQSFDKAVLVLYRDGREVGTLTFEEDAVGMGRPTIQYDEALFGMEDLQLRARIAPRVERPGFRIQAGVITLRYTATEPPVTPAAEATPPR